MTRHPVSFIRPVPISRTKCPKKERFFAADLATYLRISTCLVGNFARKKKIARYARIVKRTFAEQEVVWVTRRGARLVLEHFRALQGESALRGRDWYADRERDIQAMARYNRAAALVAPTPGPKPPRLPWRSGKSFPGLVGER